jgi:hypothetical protein
MSEDHRTVHAQQAFELTDVFGYKFNPLTFGSVVKRRLRLMEPDGPSTAGGRQARQSLVLAPDDEEAAGAVVVGFIDVVQKTAEIRSYEAVSKQFAARYKKKFDLDRETFDLLVAELGGFLKIQKIDHKVVQSAPVPKRTQPEAPVDESGSSMAGPLLGMLALGILVGFGLGYLVFGVTG